MRRLAFLVAVFGGAAVLVASSMAAPRSASILIRHQKQGCHTWSLNGGPWRASLTVALARGGTVTILNKDIMPQALIQKSGVKVRETGDPKMSTRGASVKVTFPKAGTYRFATVAGEDFPGMERPTVGEDNNLTLTVKVS